MQPETASPSFDPKWLVLPLSLLVLILFLGYQTHRQGFAPRTDLTQSVGFYPAYGEARTLSQILQMPDSAWSYNSNAELSFGTTNTPHWFRFALPAEVTNGEWLIELDNPLIDSFNVWFVRGDEVISEYQTGDRFPFAQRPVYHERFVIEVPQVAGDIQVIMMAQSSGVLRLPLSVWSKSVYDAYSAQQNLMIGLFFGFLLAMMLSNLFLFSNSGSLTYVAYSGYVLLLSLFMATISGLGYKYLWPDSVWLQERAISVTGNLAIMFSLMLSLRLMDIQRHSQLLFKIVKVSLAILVLLVIVSLFIPAGLVMPLGGASLVAGLLVKAVSGGMLWRRKEKFSRYYMTGLVFLLLSAFGALLEATNAIAFGVSPFYMLMLGITAELMVLMLALGKRYSEQREAQFKEQYEALMAERQARIEQQQQILENEKAQHELEYDVQERNLELEIALRELSETNRELEKLNTTDALTGLRNRRYFDKKYLAETRRSRREQTELSIAMIDIDHFKRINDTHGHLIGDECIRRVAEVLEQTLKRPGDDACRYGGEEFAVILPNTNDTGAQQLAESIRKNIESMNINTTAGEISITVSVGICTSVIHSEEQEKMLLESADAALYDAKNSGRNKTCSSILSATSETNQEPT